MQFSWKKPSILPGFKLTLGYSLFYLSLLVLIPLSTLFLKSASLHWADFWNTITAPRVLAAYRLSLLTALIAAAINTVFGLLLAWVLTRYSFPGKRIMDSLIDLPFALPTAVAGITLTTLYAPNGLIGKYLAALGINVAYTPLGIILALTFISLPFVVRTVQPVLETLDPDMEEASACLGAKRLATYFYIILPQLRPALFTGFSLAFARALGEYGSVVFISGNMPFKTEMTPLLIMTKLEQFDYTGATSIAVVMLLFSFLILMTINLMNWKLAK